MGYLDSILLGITQGVTEFLPISSDGHLALVYSMLGKAPNLTFEIFLHFATLLAILTFFRQDVVRLLASFLPKNREHKAERRLALLIAGGTVVTAVVAIALKPLVEPASASFVWVGAGFLATTVMLVLGEVLIKWESTVPEPSDLPIWKVAPIAIAQGLAVMPGLSRSGSTIAVGMLAGLKREDAARFSFLLGIPIITMASAVDGLDLFAGKTSLPAAPVSAVGFVTALLTGYAAIWFLLEIVKRHSLVWFAAYTGVLGTVILVLGLTGRG